MTPSKIRQAACVALSLIALALASTAWADHLLITRAFSGIWDQPDHESQGLVLQIAEDGEGNRQGVAYWFTFAEDLESAWYVGIGPVDGHTVDMQLYRASGTGFLEEEVPENVPVEAIGTLLLDFHNCNQGTAFFDTEDPLLGQGEFRISRLASIYHMRCSGGISDDTPPDARPQILSVRLNPARDDVTGSGLAKFWGRADRSDFKVQVENVADGEYELFVCGDSRGLFEVVAGEGGLEFRSPQSDSKPLLNFDPLDDCVIEVADAGGVALTSGEARLAEGPVGPPNPKPADGDEIEVDLLETGIIPDARGTASLEMEDGGERFVVTVRDVPVGDYIVRVDGNEEGPLTVQQMGQNTRGRAAFSEPQQPGDEPLDFDPRGKVIEVLSGSDVILDALFPDS